MRNCTSCGSSNIDSAKFCNDCGTKMPDLAPAVKETAKTIDFSKMSGFPAKATAKRHADIIHYVRFGLYGQYAGRNRHHERDDRRIRR
jgi:uncharacterized membrane protein YvbJ